jgi:hypothetical protein
VLVVVVQAVVPVAQVLADTEAVMVVALVALVLQVVL